MLRSMLYQKADRAGDAGERYQRYITRHYYKPVLMLPDPQELGHAWIDVLKVRSRQEEFLLYQL